jgi:hypothetical protein
MLMRRATRGQLPLVEAATRLQDELLTPEFSEPAGAWGREEQAVANLKKLALLLAGLGMRRFGTALEQEQEVVAGIGDVLIDTFAAESAILRAQRPDAGASAETLARLFLDEALDRANSHATLLLPHLADGDDLRILLSTARRLAKREPLDIIAMQREAAVAVLAAGGYPG